MEFQERFLYHIWDEGHLLPGLRTFSGKELKVIYQGHYNTNRGPDFINASIVIGDEALTGNVEIHLDPRDWERHNHHEDHYFNSTILHVVYENVKHVIHTIKENGEAIEILELKPYLTEDISKLIAKKTLTSNCDKNYYCDLLSLSSQDYLYSVFSEYGKKRFWSKVRRYNAMLTFEDFDQLLYQGVMEALGYDKNKYNMLSIAQEIKWKDITSWNKEGLKTEDLIAILCVASGILHKNTKLIENKMTAEIYANYEKQNYYSGKLQIEWQLFRVRPQNHPIYRIIRISALWCKIASNGFLKTIIGVYEKNKSSAFFTAFCDTVCIKLDEYSSIPPIGKSVLSNIFLNIILPITYLYMQKIGDENAKQDIIDIYRSFPAMSPNHITRHMSSKLSPNARFKQSAHLQQGMLELYNRYCQYHLCDQCKSEFKKDIQ